MVALFILIAVLATVSVLGREEVWGAIFLELWHVSECRVKTYRTQDILGRMFFSYFDLFLLLMEVI